MKLTIENKSQVNLHGLKPGAKMQIEADAEGTPLEKHWRRRFADSEIDGAIQVVSSRAKVKEDKK